MALAQSLFIWAIYTFKWNQNVLKFFQIKLKSLFSFQKNFKTAQNLGTGGINTINAIEKCWFYVETLPEQNYNRVIDRTWKFYTLDLNLAKTMMSKKSCTSSIVLVCEPTLPKVVQEYLWSSLDLSISQLKLSASSIAMRSNICFAKKSFIRCFTVTNWSDLLSKSSEITFLKMKRHQQLW